MRSLLLVGLILISSIAYSQDPLRGSGKDIQTPQKQAKKSQKPSSENQLGTESRPLVVQSESSTAESKKKGKDESFADWWPFGAEWSAAIFTWLLVVVGGVTAVVLYYQARQMRRTVDAMREEYVSTHRPKIRVRHVWAEGDLWGEGQIGIRAQIVNIGVTTAKITEYCATTLLLIESKQLPSIPQYGHKVAVQVDPFLKSGYSTDLPATGDLAALKDHIRPISHDDNAAIRDRTQKLYAFGYVRYEDPAGRPMTTAFCRVLEPATGIGSGTEIGRFVRLPEQNTDYEYED